MATHTLREHQETELITLHDGDFIDLDGIVVRASFGEGETIQLTPKQFEALKSGLRQAILKQQTAKRVSSYFDSTIVTKYVNSFASRMTRDLMKVLPHGG